MGITVIIPTYQRKYDLERLFGSMANQVDMPEEIIIVIGPGDEASVILAKEWREKIPSVKVIQTAKASLVSSINQGLRASSQEIICLIDDDVWLPSDWLSKIKFAYSRDAKLGAFGGRDHIQLKNHPHLTEPKPAKIVGTYTWSGSLKGFHHCGSVQSPVYVDVLKGANLSFRKSALSNLQIEPGLEGQGAEICTEIDICLRIKEAGFHVVYDNDNYVLHYASPRVESDNRVNIFSPTLPFRIRNEALVTAKFRPYFQIIIYIIRTVLVGTRYQPGILRLPLLIKHHGVKSLKFPFINLKYVLIGLQKGFLLRKSKKRSAQKLLKL